MSSLSQRLKGRSPFQRLKGRSLAWLLIVAAVATGTPALSQSPSADPAIGEVPAARDAVEPGTAPAKLQPGVPVPLNVEIKIPSLPAAATVRVPANVESAAPARATPGTVAAPNQHPVTAPVQPAMADAPAHVPPPAAIAGPASPRADATAPAASETAVSPQKPAAAAAGQPAAAEGPIAPSQDSTQAEAPAKAIPVTPAPAAAPLAGAVPVKPEAAKNALLPAASAPDSAPPSATGPATVPAQIPAAQPAAVAPAPAVKAEAPKKGPSGHLEATEPGQKDVLTDRTDQILKTERDKAGDMVHPLALRYPGHNVVICTAGCGAGGKVVHMEPKGQKSFAEQAEMIPSSAQAGDAAFGPPAGAITCIAGCYTTPKSYRAADKRANLVPLNPVKPAAATAAPVAVPMAPAAVAPEAAVKPAVPRVSATADAMSGKWTATVAPAAADAPSVAPGPAPELPAANAKKAGQRSMGSGDWMNKINDDRAGTALPGQ